MRSFVELDLVPVNPSVFFPFSFSFFLRLCCAAHSRMNIFKGQVLTYNLYRLFFWIKIFKYVELPSSLQLQNRSWCVYVIGSWYHRFWWSPFCRRVFVCVVIWMVRASRRLIFIRILHEKKKLTMFRRNTVDCIGWIPRRSNTSRFCHFRIDIEHMIRWRILDDERRCVAHTFRFVKDTVRTLVTKKQ